MSTASKRKLEESEEVEKPAPKRRATSKLSRTLSEPSASSSESTTVVRDHDFAITPSDPIPESLPLPDPKSPTEEVIPEIDATQGENKALTTSTMVPRSVIRTHYFFEEFRKEFVTVPASKTYDPKKGDMTGQAFLTNIVYNGRREVIFQSHDALQVMFDMKIPQKKGENKMLPQEGEVVYGLTVNIGDQEHLDHVAINGVIDVCNVALVNHLVENKHNYQFLKKMDLHKEKEDMQLKMISTTLNCPRLSLDGQIGMKIKVKATVHGGVPHFSQSFLLMPDFIPLQGFDVLNYLKRGASILPMVKISPVWLTNACTYSFELVQAVVWEGQEDKPKLIIPSRVELAPHLAYPNLDKLSDVPAIGAPQPRHEGEISSTISEEGEGKSFFEHAQ